MIAGPGPATPTLSPSLSLSTAQVWLRSDLWLVACNSQPRAAALSAICFHRCTFNTGTNTNHPSCCWLLPGRAPRNFTVRVFAASISRVGLTAQSRRLQVLQGSGKHEEGNISLCQRTFYDQSACPIYQPPHTVWIVCRYCVEIVWCVGR